MSRGRILPTLLFLRWAQRVNHKQQWAEGRVAPGDCAPLWALAAPTPSSATPPSTSAATGASATASRLCRGLLATGLVQLVLAEVLRVLRRRLLRLGSTTTPTCTATPTRHGLPRGTAAATAATSLHLRVVEVSSWDIATAGHGWQHRGSRVQQKGQCRGRLTPWRRSVCAAFLVAAVFLPPRPAPRPAPRPRPAPLPRPAPRPAPFLGVAFFLPSFFVVVMMSSARVEAPSVHQPHPLTVGWQRGVGRQ